MSLGISVVFFIERMTVNTLRGGWRQLYSAAGRGIAE